MGEPLAKAEVQIFFVSLVQGLRIMSVQGRAPGPARYTSGITKCPRAFVVAVKKRKDHNIIEG